MGRYSLWISDCHLNKFCVPLSRDRQTSKEKVDLYEIDLVTVSLGKEAFIETLKQCNIAPNDFDWNSAYGNIQYQCNHKTCYLPLLFKKDDLLRDVLNFQNKYRYRIGKTEGKILAEFKRRPLQTDFSIMLSSLANYRDYILNEVKKNHQLLKDCNIPEKLAQKLYSCIQSTDYDEQIEYKNDIVTEMLSYITFRRLKAMEYACYTDQKLTNVSSINSISEEREIDPDEFAFLSKEELDMMDDVSSEDKKL